MNDNIVELKPSNNLLEASEELNAAISKDPSLLDFNEVDEKMNYALHNGDDKALESSITAVVDFTLKACEKDPEKMRALQNYIPGITTAEVSDLLDADNKKYIDDVIVYLDQLEKANDKINEEATEKWEEVRDTNQAEVDEMITEINGRGRGAA